MTRDVSFWIFDTIEIMNLAKQIQHPKFKTANGELVTTQNAKTVMMQLLDPTRHVDDSPTKSDALAKLHRLDLSEEEKKKGATTLYPLLLHL